MARTGLSKLREKQRFTLEGTKNVVIHFGKHQNRSFKDISNEDPEYFDYLLENWSTQMTAEVQKRVRYWQNRSGQFFI